MNIPNFIEELKRRNVFRVATAYAIAGWLIIQIATSVFPAFEFPDWTQQFVIIITMIGFPLALIFAWAFELTPEGIKKSKEVDITESVTSRTGKKLNGIIITVLSMAVIFLLVERVFFAKASILEQENSTNIEMASIAVLPFVNMSSDEENEFFSDGLSEELLNGLAKIEGMQVAGRTSAFSFKGKNEDLRIVGEQLGVKHILEGSVRKDGNTLRITAQLIQADNGFHLWSETYDRQIESVFAIQEEITRKVVAELKVRLLPQEEIQLTERPTQDIEAYNAYLEATQLEINRLPSDLEKAIEKYKQAIAIDPTFALAYARLAIAYHLSFRFGSEFSTEKRVETASLMRENIDQALLLDGNLGKAYEALGEYYVYADGGDWVERLEKALFAYSKAVELSPNDAFAHYGYYTYLSMKDRRELEKIQLTTYQVLEEAYELDPLNPVVAQVYANYLIDIKQEFEKGLSIMNQVIENYPDFMPIKVDKSWVMRDIPYGRPDEAFKYMFEAHLDDPRNIRYMNALVETSLDVDFLTFAKYMVEKIEENTPEDRQFFTTYNSKRKILQAEKDYDGFEALVEERIDLILSRNENLQRESYIGSFPLVYYNQGRYDEVIEIAKIRASELFEPDFIAADSNEFYIRIYVPILLKRGELQEAKRIADSFCSSLPKDVKGLDDYDDISEFYFNQSDCDIFLGKFEEGIEGTRKGYFELNSKANWPLVFQEPVYSLVEEHPSFIKFKEDVYKDLHSMRSNVIQFLKAEGEWREEWDVKE